MQAETDLVPLRNRGGRRLRYITVREAISMPGVNLRKNKAGVISQVIESQRFVPRESVGRAWRDSDVTTQAAIQIAANQAKHKFYESNAAGSHGEAEWQRVLDRYGRRCLRCDVSEADIPLTKDHVVPLSEGGTDYASNLQPLCRSCNSWKGNREIDFRNSADRDETRSIATTAA